MSSEAVVGAYPVPTCRRDEYLQVCVGPPSTAPHDIALPSVDEAVEVGHDRGHHGTPSDSPSKCKICRAIATHIQSCSTCLATFIRCVRNDCQSAWNPFEALIVPIATALGRRCIGMTPAFVDEAISVATEKGMGLIFVHPSCDPEAVFKDGRGLRGLLWASMWNSVKSFIERKHPTAEVLVFDRDDDEPLTVFDTYPIEGARVASDDPVIDEVSSNDNVAILGRIIVCYLDSLDPTDRYIFQQWYAKATGGIGSTQQEIGRHLGQQQSRISRRIKAFKKALVALLDDPDNGLDDETRACARSLFLATDLTSEAKGDRSSMMSTASIDGSDPTYHDSVSAADHQPTLEDSEGHDD